MVASQMLFMADHSCWMVNFLTLYECCWRLLFELADYKFISLLLLGLPPLVLRRILEILTYLATNHSSVSNMLFYFDSLNVPDSLIPKCSETKDKGKEKIVDGETSLEYKEDLEDGSVPLILLLKLLNRPLFLRSTQHLEQV